MIYAPVLIVTLNRHNHFRQCLESLEKCTGAKNTVVYVALDYPPSERYVDGWEKNDLYLKEKERTNQFAKLVVFRRDKNYGIGKIGSNSTVLLEYVRQRHDCYIFSEDDNIFSPNFLEFMNKGLEKYKKDSSVLAITGYVQPYEFKHGKNTYYRHRTNFSAWGYGTWSSKIESMNNDINGNYFRKNFNIRNILKVRKFGRTHLSHFFLYGPGSKGFFWITDQVTALYLIIHDMDVICPTVTKVRNIGWDALGNSFKSGHLTEAQQKRGEVYRNQPIDLNSQFEYIGDGYDYYNYNNQLAASYCWSKWECFRCCIRGLFLYVGREKRINRIYHKINAFFK